MKLGHDLHEYISGARLVVQHAWRAGLNYHRGLCVLQRATQPGDLSRVFSRV